MAAYALAVRLFIQARVVKGATCDADLYQRHKVSGILFVVKAKLPLLAR